MPIRAVAFDLDGLMFNTEMIYDKVGEELLLRRGKLMTSELKRAMIGRRAQESLTLMIDMHGLNDTVDDLITESHELFFEAAVGRLAPMPGLYELLEFLEASKFSKALTTSSSHQYVQRVVGPFGLLHRFPIILASEDVTQGKPHPEIYLKAANQMGIEPGEMMVLEDSQNGTNSAAAAGAVAVAVPHEHTRHHDFSRATLIADSLHDPRVFDLLRG
ncbi:MAG: HAD-superfamily hydrolase, subfamily variant 3 [Planctomycetaceae bacterium]|nr:HAD-superfamily hydrolase, subfamily variant 3 [Planctomycetaceae bacterium]